MPPRRGIILLLPALLVTIGLYHVVFPAQTTAVFEHIHSFASSGPRFDPKSHRVFLTTRPVWHEEVWMTLGSMFDDLGVNTTAFVECDGVQTTCIRFNLMNVAEKLGMGRKLRGKDELFQAVHDRMPDGRYVDTVVLATENRDFDWASDHLLQIWHERPDDEKFRVVAVYHEPTGDLERYVQDWSPTGALSFLTLSPHVGVHLKHRLSLLTASAEAWSRVEQVKVRTVIPWIPAAEGGLVGTPRPGDVVRSKHRRPSRVSINGMISPERRAYGKVFDDLAKWFKDDPEPWGYRFNLTTQQYYAIDPADPETFKVLILGQRDNRYEDLPDPGPLKEVVEFHGGYNQAELYDYMASTDMLLLGWNGGYRYLDSQASSSAFTTLETEVPLVITSQIANAYSFLDPSISIIKPHAISEIDAVMLFRRFPNTEGKSLPELEKLAAGFFGPPWHKSVPREAAKMLQQGWKRKDSAWKSKKAALHKENSRLIKELLTEELEI